MKCRILAEGEEVDRVFDGLVVKKREEPIEFYFEFFLYVVD